MRRREPTFSVLVDLRYGDRSSSRVGRESLGNVPRDSSPTLDQKADRKVTDGKDKVLIVGQDAIERQSS